MLAPIALCSYTMFATALCTCKLAPRVCSSHSPSAVGLHNVYKHIMYMQVAKALVKEAESNSGKKEYDANDSLIRHSDATKIQSIADRVKLHGDGGPLPEAVSLVAEAVKHLGIAETPEE